MLPTPDTYVEAGVYEVNQGLYTSHYFGSGFPNNISQESGVYVPVEIAYEPSLGPNNLAGHYKFGFGYDTTLYESFFSALPTPPESCPRDVPTTSSSGCWRTRCWFARATATRTASSRSPDLPITTRTSRPLPSNTSPALIDRGFWRARPQDTVAFFFNYNTMSGPLGKVQAEEAELGIPFSNGATGVQTHEMFLEANYNIHVYRGVDFRPEFQYVIRPNAQSNIRDAAVLGFKAHVQF